MSDVAVEIPEDASIPDICILDAAPERFNRLLVLLKGRGYAASWVHVQKKITERKDKDGILITVDPPELQVHQELVIIRDNGQFFTDAPLPGANPIKKLEMDIHLNDIPASNLLWSGSGINRFIADERPAAVSVFNDVCDVVDHYMDFYGSFGEQKDMCELIACYCMATYMLDAFPVTGYLWPNGEPGSGKTHLLHIISVLAYLGQFITAGGSFASIRDLAGYGATLCFDDAEKIMDRRGDPDKQSLLLAGNRKGTTVPYKVLEKDKQWVTRHVNAYCPKCFSAVGLPNDTLSSRTIFIPLLASDDSQKANSDPLDDDTWPVDRKRLMDDLWALSLVNLRKMPSIDKRAAKLSGLSGRAYQPWRSILATALWLDDKGLVGLFERMKGLTVAYGKENNFSAATHKMIVLKALRKIVDSRPYASEVVFATKTLKGHINQIAIDDDLMDEKADHQGNEHDYINSRSLGWRLNRMRLKRPEGRSANAREWIISAATLERLERTNGIASVLTSQMAEMSQTTQNHQKSWVTSDVNDVNDVSDVLPERSIGSDKCQKCDGEGCRHCRILE